MAASKTFDTYVEGLNEKAIMMHEEIYELDAELRSKA